MIFLFQRLIFDKSFFMGDFLKDDNKAIGTSGRRLNKQTYSTILAALKNPSFLYDRIIYYIENSARTTIQKKVLIVSPPNIAEGLASVGKQYKGYTFFTTKDTFAFLDEYRVDF